MFYFNESWGLFWFYVLYIEGFSIYIFFVDDFKVNKIRKNILW